MVPSLTKKSTNETRSLKMRPSRLTLAILFPLQQDPDSLMTLFPMLKKRHLTCSTNSNSDDDVSTMIMITINTTFIIITYKAVLYTNYLISLHSIPRKHILLSSPF